MAERELLVRIVGDDRDLQRALKNTDRSTQRIDNRMQSFGRSAKGAFAAAGIAFGGAAVFAALERSVGAASDLNEQISKSRQVFKESSAEVEAWSRTTAQSIGISQRAALTAAGTFGNLFNAVGLAPKAAGDMSRALVKLAADLASFNNANPEDVLVALRSGLVGEAEPLRRFGVLLSESRVQIEAMAETGKTNVKSLTDQEKAIARYNIILKDTAPAQGDFARTSGGLANQQRELKANMEDLSATLGNTLVPALTAATVGMNDLVGGTLNLIGSLRDLRESIQGTDFFEGFNKGVEEGSTGVGGFFLKIRDGIPLVNELRDAITGAGVAAADLVGPNAEGKSSPGLVSQSNREVEAKKQTKAAKKAAKDLDASRKAFAESIKGLGLKLEKTGLTASFADDLGVIREIERRIQKQIEIEGHTFELEQALVRARTQEQGILERISAAGEEKQTKKTKTIAKKAEDERAKRKRIRERAAAARKAEQFEELGLTAEGDKPTPSSGALLRRAQSIQDQVKGTTLDTSKTRKQLQLIVTFLKKNFKTAGKEVRQAILSMLNDINTAGEAGSKSGPLTKTTSLNSKKVLANLGLSPEEIRALRGRLSNFNSAGVGFAGANNTRATGAFSAPIVVDSHITINLDGQKVASSVTRNQQRHDKRNPQQKRGPNRR